MSRALRFAPLVIFGLIVIAMLWRLMTPADTSVRSQLEGRAIPGFTLDAAIPGKPGLSSADLATGKPHLLNVFASWCVPCAGEVKVLAELQRKGIAVDGIAIRDRPGDLTAFLHRNGDPYQRIGNDPKSQVQISLGSSGVPETFVVDGRGVIRQQHIGAVEQEDIEPLLKQLEQAR